MNTNNSTLLTTQDLSIAFGGLVVVAGTGGYLIYDNNKDEKLWAFCALHSNTLHRAKRAILVL